jgi:hypothetical protein
MMGRPFAAGLASSGLAATAKPNEDDAKPAAISAASTRHGEDDAMPAAISAAEAPAAAVAAKPEDAKPAAKGRPIMETPVVNKPRFDIIKAHPDQNTASAMKGALMDMIHKMSPNSRVEVSLIAVPAYKNASIKLSGQFLPWVWIPLLAKVKEIKNLVHYSDEELEEYVLDNAHELSQNSILRQLVYDEHLTGEDAGGGVHHKFVREKITPKQLKDCIRARFGKKTQKITEKIRAALKSKNEEFLANIELVEELIEAGSVQAALKLQGIFVSVP